MIYLVTHKDSNARSTVILTHPQPIKYLSILITNMIHNGNKTSEDQWNL